jgi:hypothetical protein
VIGQLLRRVVRGFGYRLIRLAQVGGDVGLDLTGDRDIEWAWVAANLPEFPGRVLDFGPSTAPSGLIAAFRGAGVTAIDLEAQSPPYVHPALALRHGDLLTAAFGEQKFDTVINCSTVEHVGLSGRYGSAEAPDGDLMAMRRLCELMGGATARMILTVPVGRDAVYAPIHRIYGQTRLPLLLAGFRSVREAYFAKQAEDSRWHEVTREHALAVEGSRSFYALGLFVLALA